MLTNVFHSSQAETYELENRILKDINEKQDRDIRALEMEISALKQTNMVHEHERRRAESKVSSTFRTYNLTSGKGNSTLDLFRTAFVLFATLVSQQLFWRAVQ